MTTIDNPSGGIKVADNDSKIPSPFDVRTVRDLVALMSRHDLNEIDLREGELRIRLRRGPRGQVAVSMPGPSVPAFVPAAATQNAPAPALAATQEPAKSSKKLLEIKSQAIGTFYAAGSPDAEPFVRIGARVAPKTVVCVVEAMKTFNEITADCTGVITEICVENQQPVEFDQVLFRVDPAG